MAERKESEKENEKEQQHKNRPRKTEEVRREREEKGREWDIMRTEQRQQIEVDASSRV